MPLFVFQPLIFNLQFSIFTLLRLLIESPCQSHHAIAGDDVVEGLGHALGIDVVARVAEFAEDVEGIKLQEEIAVDGYLNTGLWLTSIPVSQNVPNVECI